MPGILCEHCTALCCRYIALPLETPEDREDFDDIRWYLLHENVSIFVEKGEWYISFVANCRHLLPDNRCGIYETRPRICRKYETANCDYHSGEYGWDHHFMSPEHLDEYVRRRFDGRPKIRPRKQDNGRRKSDEKSPSRVAPAAATARKVPRADLRGVPLPVLGT